jgi:hypothetical protein
VRPEDGLFAVFIGARHWTYPEPAETSPQRYFLFIYVNANVHLSNI